MTARPGVLAGPLPRMAPFLRVTCATSGCMQRDKVRLVGLKLAAPGMFAVPALVCSHCGAKPLWIDAEGRTSGMVLRACLECTTSFAVGLERCPQCGSTNHVEEGSEEHMAKIGRETGPTDQLAGPGEAGFMPEVDGDDGPTQVPAAGTEGIDTTRPVEAPERVDTVEIGGAPADTEPQTDAQTDAGEQDPAGAEQASGSEQGAESDAGGMRDGDDPANFTISQVTAHLDQASDTERTRVLDAERAGKNRKGIVGDG